MYQPERIKAAQHQKTWVKLWTQHWGGSARVGNEIRNKAEGGNKIALKLFFWQVNLKKRRPAMIPERALETSTRIQNSRTDVPIQDLGSMCPNLTNFEYLWIQVAPEIPKNDWSKHIKTGAEAKILLETSDTTWDKTASPAQGPRFQSRQSQLLKTNRLHQKKQPKIPELTIGPQTQKRCFTKIPELTQEKPKRFLKQLPGPMIPQSVLESKSWLLKTGAPIQYSRIEFWNWRQLLKRSPGPKTPELIPDTRSWGHWKQVPKPEFSLEKSLRT